MTDALTFTAGILFLVLGAQALWLVVFGEALTTDTPASGDSATSAADGWAA